MAIVMFKLTGDYRMALGANKDISKIIRRQRTKLSLTQEQFAAKVGVTYSTVNRWENNKAKPSPLALQRIKELQKESKEK
ncbi:MAG: helix-turn-helix domain-containing protein [Sedimentisphaerales bacterium]|nr:helix-turn-helix domain-containing protein [Sedimentisphaerales bacterium]